MCSGLVRTLYGMHISAGSMIRFAFLFGSSSSSTPTSLIEQSLDWVLLWLSIGLRILFTVFYQLCDLQLWYAAAIAVAGGLSAARNVLWNTASLWERTSSIEQSEIIDAASSMLDRRPSVCNAISDLAPNERRNREMQFFSELWNEGLLQDLRRSHRIDRTQEEQLRIRRPDAADQSFRLPDLSGMLPLLCLDARRSIATFLSFCQRRVGNGVPRPPLTCHQPNVTMLVPVYGETILRGWGAMFSRRAGGLCNFEYMFDSRNAEFCCLWSNDDVLHAQHRAVLRPYIQVLEGVGEAKCQALLPSPCALCDGLWFCDYLLLFHAASSSADLSQGGSSHAHKPLFELAELVLRSAVDPWRDGVHGPSVSDGMSRAVLDTVVERYDVLCRGAALELGVRVDEVAHALHMQPELGRSWQAVDEHVHAKYPMLDVSRRARMLEALGVSREKGWQADSASSFCVVLHQITLEAHIKLQLRIWYSNREQTVWRTLDGLLKARRALLQLHQQDVLLASGPGGASHGAEEHFQMPVGVLAAFQNFGGWETNFASSLAKARTLMSRLHTADARRQLHDNFFFKSEGILWLHEQLAASHYIMRMYPQLRLSFLNKTTRNGRDVFSSCLIQACEKGRQQSEAHRIRGCELDASCTELSLNLVREIDLPGNPIIDGLAEGKPVNQASALLHCTSEIVMVIDCNQGANHEQWYSLPELLSEFHSDGSGGYRPDSNVRIVGFRESIFTEDDGIVGHAGALNEFVFGTIVQRQMAVLLNARLHYGHPDCFNFASVLTQGGTSKISKLINVSEDIFGGINVFMRGGAIHYVDYIQVEKGRDVQFVAALAFEGKVAGGTSVHALSRGALDSFIECAASLCHTTLPVLSPPPPLLAYADFHRMMSAPLCFFHKTSLLIGGIGLFLANALLVHTIFAIVAMNAVASLLPRDLQYHLYQNTPAQIGLFNLGFVYLLALIVQVWAIKSCPSRTESTKWPIFSPAPKPTIVCFPPMRSCLASEGCQDRLKACSRSWQRFLSTCTRSSSTSILCTAALRVVLRSTLRLAVTLQQCVSASLSTSSSSRTPTLLRHST